MLNGMINGADYQFHSLADLARELDQGHHEEYREIYIEHGEASMFALAARDIAWLMMLRFSGDAGYSSRNSDFAGDDGQVMDFQLSNGQVDEYPVAWTLPKHLWIPALLHFAETGKRSGLVHWHFDG